MAVPPDIVATIDAEQQKVRDAFKMGDYDAMTETFTVDCLYIGPFAPAIKGRPGVKEALRQFGVQGITDFIFSHRENQLLGEFVFRDGEITLLKGKEEFAMYNFTQVWRKDVDGQYRHLIEMVNILKPPSS